MITGEEKEVLITVKAYPNPSAKYGETVCCAGIDLSNNQWIRLYPIPFRDLDIDKKFNKYNIIKVNCFKSKTDNRPESYHVNSDSIKIVKNIDTKRNWEERKSHIMQLPIKSMCQFYKDLEKNNISLALIKPERISFESIAQKPSDKKRREECYAQLSFFNKYKDDIEEIPYKFYYNFYCSGEKECQGHKLSICDWEIGQAYRNWRNKYDNEIILLDKIKEKWMDISNTDKRDVYFYVGNMHRFPTNFLVLGVFYPRLNK